jgi:putative Holliday junction resolvase
MFLPGDPPTAPYVQYGIPAGDCEVTISPGGAAKNTAPAARRFACISTPFPCMIAYAMIPSAPEQPTHLLDRHMLAVDYGTRRTGLALYRPGRYSYPVPYLQLPYRSDDALLQDVTRIVREESIELVVLGVPRLLDGTETTMSRRILDFGERLAPVLLPVPLYQQDESLSTFEAQERMKSSARYNFKIDPRQVDALAASIVLEDFIKRLHPGVPDLPF